MKSAKLIAGILLLLFGILALFALALSSHTGVFKENIVWVILAFAGIIIGVYAIATSNKS